jgi:hypothetical protein
MPLPKPNKSENRYLFMNRCVNSVIAKRDYEDPEERIRACELIYQQTIKE